MAQTRIIGGQWRGRLIETPAGTNTRPAKSQVREALFNILAPKVVDAKLLDIYAGAGTIGFEALSRGAREVTFVEYSHNVITCLRKTADKLKCQNGVQIVQAEVISWLKRSADQIAGADLVFVGAPYKDDMMLSAMQIIGKQSHGLVICEHHRQREMPEKIGNLQCVRQAKYGITQLSFFQLMEEK